MPNIYRRHSLFHLPCAFHRYYSAELGFGHAWKLDRIGQGVRASIRMMLVYFVFTFLLQGKGQTGTDDVGMDIIGIVRLPALIFYGNKNWRYIVRR